MNHHRRFAPLFALTFAAAAFVGCKGQSADTDADAPAAGTPTTAEAPAAPTDIPAPDDVAAAPADAQKTESGLSYKVLSKSAETQKPNKWDTVEVHYTGWTTDGKMFDSSVARGRTAKFPLKGVIPGWTEGLQLMAVNEKARFWIPKELAYNGMPGKPAGMLVFDVELFNIIPGVPPVPAPEDVGAIPADAKKTASGLAYRVMTPATGKAKPTEEDRVEVHYTGWMTNGEMFDSSVQRGQPATFGLRGVIRGWTEGLQLMAEGQKNRFWIPADLAYGEQPRRPGGPSGMLVFDIELLKVHKAPEPPKVPADVAAVPKGAEKSASGLAWKVLKAGTGSKKPTTTDRVQVHYSGWTTDGKMFDSSVTRGRPATFGVSGVIKGWTEGLQLMVEGEQRRFWIPANLAYGENPGGGRPGGMLVFDVELLKVF